MAKTYLYAVQKDTGHEVVSAEVEVAKVGDVEAQWLESGLVRLVHLGDVVATGAEVVDFSVELTLYRWPADDKLADPVAHPVYPPESYEPPEEAG